MAVAAALVALCGCGAGARHAAATSSDPLAGQRFYVEPDGPAAAQAARWRGEGRGQEAASIERIAAQPIATWLTQGEGVQARVEALTTRAAEAGRSALLVAYDIPDRDCSGYSAGGAPNAAAYRAYIAALARGIGSRKATVIVEPDAVPQALYGCLDPTARAQRLTLLSAAVTALRGDPHVSVYLDAGNVGWLTHPRQVADALRRAGIARADGFSLNVSSFYSTHATIEAGTKLSRLLGGKHFIVDTSRNGRGPALAAGGSVIWCNPTGRALGTAPTTDTGQPLVDAYLWIKRPGESDGTCRPGAPAAGTWWPQYALELVRNSAG